MEITYCYNENWACRTRGSESDHPNITETITARTTREAALAIAGDVFGWDNDETVDYLGEVSLGNLINYADSVDISGGEAILFWVQINQNPRLETAWAEDEFDFIEDDED